MPAFAIAQVPSLPLRDAARARRQLCQLSKLDGLRPPRALAQLDIRPAEPLGGSTRPPAHSLHRPAPPLRPIGAFVPGEARGFVDRTDQGKGPGGHIGNPCRRIGYPDAYDEERLRLRLGGGASVARRLSAIIAIWFGLSAR